MQSFEVNVKRIEWGFAPITATDKETAIKHIDGHDVVWGKEEFEVQDVVCVKEDVVVMAYPELQSTEISP